MYIEKRFALYSDSYAEIESTHTASVRGSAGGFGGPTDYEKLQA